jgi:hypothetical protein
VRGDVPIVPGGLSAMSLVVEHDGLERTVVIAMAAPTETDAHRDVARLVELAILLVWLAIVRAWPFAAMEHGPSRPAAALARPTAAIVARAGALLVASIAVVRVVASGVLPPAPLVVAAIVGARATLLFAEARGDVRELGRIVTSSVGLAAGLGGLPLALGTADLAALARDGTPSPLGWPAFTEPVGPLALAALVVGLAATRARQRLARALDDVLVIAIAALVVVVGTGLSPIGRTGTVALTLATAFVAAGLGHVRGSLRPLPGAITIAVLVAVAALALGAWTVADPSELVRETAAETLVAMCVVGAAAALRRATVRREPIRATSALL